MDFKRRAHRRPTKCSGIEFLFVTITAITLILVILHLITLNTSVQLNMEETKVVNGNYAKLHEGSSSGEREIAPMIRRLPQAIIIGSRKSGTRALLKFLSANPNIRAASKEVHFFDRMQNYKLGLDWYRAQMPPTLASQITIEKSPAYFVTKGVPERIESMNSSIKLILVVRDPVKRLISDFSQLLAHKALKEHPGWIGRDYDDYYHYVLSGEASIAERQQETRKGLNFSAEKIWIQAEAGFEDYVRRSDGGINDQRRAIRAGMYSSHLERWLAVFSREQLHVVDGERLISDPASELRQVEAFLGLVPSITRADFVFNQTKGFFCLVARNSSLKLDDQSHKLDRRKRETITQTPVCLGNDKGRRHVKVKQSLSNELQQFYDPFNEYLYSLVGRNLNWTQQEMRIK